jgi:hypothetical protein
MYLLPGKLARGSSGPYFPVQANQSFELVKFSIFVDGRSHHERAHFIRLPNFGLLFNRGFIDVSPGVMRYIVFSNSLDYGSMVDRLRLNGENRKCGCTQMTLMSIVLL